MRLGVLVSDRFSTHFFTWRTVMRFVTKLAVVLVLASLAIVPATADTVSLEASADAWGLAGYYNENWNPDMNYGAQTDPYGTVVQCRWTGSGSMSSNQKFWVKFDLSSIQGTPTSATLQLTRKGGANDGPDAVLVGRLSDGDPGENWGEYTITYNNAPGNVLNDYTFNWSGNMPYIGAIDYSASGAVGDVLTLTGDSLLAAVNGDTNHSLTLGFTKRGYDPGSAIFASREDSFYAGATLVLTGVTAVPEPGTVMLLCMGLVGLLAYAWRKRK
jgi:hypothetical protein